MTTKLRRGATFGRWTLQERKGTGGNGEVWKAVSGTGELCAIKFLKPGRAEKGYTRFKDEITVLLRNPDLEGVIPIIDHALPEYSQAATPWYAMPLAETLSSYLNNVTTNEIILTFVKLARALSNIHARNITHRDIKPANLFYHDGEPVFGDWGLVEYPDKLDVTTRFETIGARWTRAPEMERDASSASGAPADVYSLAKSLWIYLTGQLTGFEGQYSATGNLAVTSYRKFNFADPLDQLLAKATDNDPSRRPTAENFAEILEEWLAANEDWYRYNPLQWQSILGKLFPNGRPARAIWYTPESIVSVLNLAAAYNSLNHLFFYPSGGNDLEGAKLGREPGTIELDMLGIHYIVRPKRLYFESFPYAAEWNYFRLETARMKRIYPMERHSFSGEPLVELASGELLLIQEWENLYDHHGGSIGEYRHISRLVEPGALVIFQKHSTYNHNPDTYDGRHNKVTAREFRNYIFQQAKRIETARQAELEDHPPV